MTELLGVLGAVLSASIGLPQAVRVLRVGTAGVSSATFQISLVLGLSWTVYALFAHMWLFALGNGILMACAAVVMWALCRSGDALWQTVRLSLVIAAAAAVVAAIEITWLGWFAGLLSISLRAPQLRLIRDAESIHGVSLNTWIISLAANITWFAYGALESDPRLLGTCAINTLLSTSLIVGIVTRRKALAAPAAVVLDEA